MDLVFCQPYMPVLLLLLDLTREVAAVSLFPQDKSLFRLLLDVLLKNSATNFENEEELSSSNCLGESYSKTVPAKH